ncbi:FGGY family carbohydrate kinase [Frigidibacter sp.]|uniref:FGGY family carbohydrate kinase n=1 Tax=Frigidibacter sp. TaxID=2586418 RepID=UPI002735CD82|nr:FGGY family carbohydrate kinase [Frigidibacter sp.]MDP3340608.1 FGGY family carbohydrate kinase [Frigidibacter sp.]
MDQVLLCLDSGTTAVKAAAFDGRGRMIASSERPNGALRREGARVEQDMEVTRAEALAVLRDCVAQLSVPVARLVSGLIITGQGDGLWPVDAAGQPVGRALTWLDGRARGLVTELAPALDAVQAITGSRPTAASASLQLLWLQRNEPEQLARIAHALRAKEWLFLSLTGRVAGEPTAALPVWGNWRDGQLAAGVEQALGLTRGLALLPEFQPVGACRAGLAADIGLPLGLPVLLGPGDVQSTLIGLGLGSRPGVARASIFGTSSIHACLHHDPASMAEAPPGAMVQQFALGPGWLCFHPSFNGATLLQHLARQFADLPAPAPPRYSGLILHPFFEPGGERSPWTDPHATGALLGLTAATTPGEIAWAGREALAFVARHSHALLGPEPGALSLGGGLAGDRHFAQFLAAATGYEVQLSPGGHAGLRGLAAIGARFLLGEELDTIAARWIGSPTETVGPQPAEITRYAAQKYALFAALVEAIRPHWPALADLQAQAEPLARRPQ